jgi:pimeloyl-ACP methyl ester carboxylesterase
MQDTSGKFVTSKDGTKIGYRQYGAGPGVVLLHGGLQASQNFTTLAQLLSDTFTVYVPDRRGRGMSAPSESLGLQKVCVRFELRRGSRATVGAYAAGNPKSGALRAAAPHQRISCDDRPDDKTV